MNLDEVDSKILRLLLENSRLSISELAKMLNLSRPTVRERLKRLVERGVIRRFTLELDPSIFNGTFLLCFLNSDNTEEVFEKLKGEKHVLEVFETHGTKNIVCLALVRDSASIENFSRFLFQIDPSFSMQVVLRRHARQLDYEFLANAGFLTLTCDYCGKIIEDEPIVFKYKNKKYYFCCKTCLREFKRKKLGL